MKVRWVQYHWIFSGISLGWRSSWSGLHSSYAVSSFQFTFYFHLTLYAHQVMMSLLYLCPCQDNERLCKSPFTILGNTSQCFPTPMQNNYFGWFNSSKGSMSPLDPLGLHHFCRFFTKKKVNNNIINKISWLRTGIVVWSLFMEEPLPVFEFLRVIYLFSFFLQ